MTDANKSDIAAAFELIEYKRKLAPLLEMDGEVPVTQQELDVLRAGLEQALEYSPGDRNQPTMAGQGTKPVRRRAGSHE